LRYLPKAIRALPNASGESKTMIEPKNIDAFILAGGESQRMGEDKGLALLKGIPMVKHVINGLVKFNLKVRLISGNENYSQFGLPVHQDLVKGKGPMGGLFTALSFSENDYVLLIGCDMPFISINLLERLTKNAKQGMVTVAESNGRINPLLAIYPKSFLGHVQKNIEGEKLKMQDFILKNPHHVVPMDNIENIDPVTYSNINSRLELVEWNQKLSK
jgi:molybdenum cofactor guanylyltransferase